MADAPLRSLDACGFIRVPGDPPLWMTCEACGKSDHFWLDDGVRCRCGARYSHAVRPDGAQVPHTQLEAVPFRQGPMQLADLEWSPARVAVLATVLLGVVGLVAWLVW